MVKAGVATCACVGLVVALCVSLSLSRVRRAAFERQQGDPERPAAAAVA